MPFWVYIQASKPRGTLYIGMTEDLVRRSREHAAGRGSAFTRKYGVGTLVWYDRFETEAEARQREKTMKEWPRAWKISTVEADNPTWGDLAADLDGPA
jgi:putative endonuclease